ncbi:ABC transporter substrate-binding protein [Solirhodobacter olei]|uniref:taurine ABC transporter substrate-binding protein n=1 Tax=Solirhodobacter olei TaxID=2493082 RepID=UPI000FD96C1A|nr:ABC transporter substrate-binding protein [Solirhodobacter olei]
MKRSWFAGLILAGMLNVPAGPAAAQSGITIAYFQEWAMPFEYAKAKGEISKAMGVPVTWRSFDTGTAMSAAMASGDVQLAISQGVPPFIVAASAGQDLQVVDVAVSYSGNDNCVVSNRLDIDKTNAKELAGKKVAVPIGTAAQYDFLKQMAHFGVDTSGMQVVDMAPPEGAVALAQGNVDMACGFGGGLQRMEQVGHVLLTGPEKDAIGLHVYDVISSPAQFVDEHPGLVTKFLGEMHKMNDMWNSGAAAQKEMLPVIAKDAGMDLPAATSMMKGFKFLSLDQALSKDWMAGGVAANLKDVGDFFVKTGNIPKARPSYADAVNIGPLKALKGM